MTEPRNRQREPQAGAAADPEVRPEVIEDLDVSGDDADRIAGGCVGGVGLPFSHQL